MTVTVILVSPGPIRFTYIFRDCVYLVSVFTFFAPSFFFSICRFQCGERTFWGGLFFWLSNSNFSRDYNGMPLDPENGKNILSLELSEEIWQMV